MNNQEKTAILQDVVRIKTENQNEREVAEYYQNLLEKHGISSQLVDHSEGRSNLLAEIKGDEPGKTLIYSGHMDVVGAGNLEDWTYPPNEAKFLTEKCTDVEQPT